MDQRAIHDLDHLRERAIRIDELAVGVTERAPLVALAAVSISSATITRMLRGQWHPAALTLASHDPNVGLNDRTNTMTFVDFDAVQKW